jgi:hypothetical protein
VLISQFPNLVQKDKEVAELLKPMFTKYIGICKSLTDTKIPALIYKGDSSNLPEIFRRINQEGTKLNKYQIFAASWTNLGIKITSSEIQELIKIVAERYDMLGGSGSIKVDNYDSVNFKRESKLNVFEIGYSFGKYLKNKYPILFGADRNNTDINSLGFNILNSCLMKKTSEMHRLNNNIKEVGDDSEINRFLVNITQCVKLLSQILQPLLIFKGNKRNVNTTLPHAELQIVSMIAQIYKFKHISYTTDNSNQLIGAKHLIYETNPAWKVDKRAIKQNVKAYYLSDLLNGEWQGSGDKKLDNILLFQHKHYLEDFSQDQFEQELNAWYVRDRNNRREREKVSIPATLEKEILNTIYLKEFSAQHHQDETKY